MDVTGNVPGLNFDYTHKFGENHSLSISSTYSSWDGVDENLVTEYSTDENYNELAIQSALKYTKDNFNYQYRLNADYKKPIKKGTLEAGFQYRYENRKDDLMLKPTNGLSIHYTPVNLIIRMIFIPATLHIRIPNGESVTCWASAPSILPGLLNSAMMQIHTIMINLCCIQAFT